MRQPRGVAGDGGSGAGTVLVTEDNPLHMKIFKLNLTFGGFTVLEAENGEKGVELARRARPDLILVDLSLPKIDGWEMISRIKGDEETRHIPVIVVSARRPQDEAAHAAMRHVAAYIPKPLDPEALMTLVHEIVEGRRATGD